MGDVANINQSKPERVVYEFDVPDSMYKEVGVKAVGLVELTADEELMASKRAGIAPFRVPFECAKEALREMDGKRLSTADGTADKAWDEMNPKLRNLLIQAYSLVHTPKDDDSTDFLRSRRVRVG